MGLEGSGFSLTLRCARRVRSLPAQRTQPNARLCRPRLQPIVLTPTRPPDRPATMTEAEPSSLEMLRKQMQYPLIKVRAPTLLHGLTLAGAHTLDMPHVVLGRTATCQRRCGRTAWTSSSLPSSASLALLRATRCAASPGRDPICPIARPPLAVLLPCYPAAVIPSALSASPVHGARPERRAMARQRSHSYL